MMEYIVVGFDTVLLNAALDNGLYARGLRCKGIDVENGKPF